jgi:hypothetical protein
MHYLNGRFILIILCLLLGTLVRINGITWGIPQDLAQHAPLHPDEAWAMTVLSQFNIDLLDLNPEEAHREGTFAYFIWGAIAYLLKLFGLIKNTPFLGQAYDNDYATVLLAGRLVTSIIDIISGVLVYMCINLCTRKFIPSFIGLLVFLFTPFEVIHAHFMRTHIIANFFICAVIYFSFRIINSKSLFNFVMIGFLSGLGIATRYPTGAILIVPALSYFHHVSSFSKIKDGVTSFIRRFLFNYGLLLLILFLLIGLFIGLPFIFLDFQAAKPHLFHQASYVAKDEFSLLGLLRLDRIIAYTNYLIPYGNLPFLWILYYLSICIIIFFRAHTKYTVPLISFMVIYLYLMAKGYFQSAIFIRAAIPIFPPLAICTGLAFDTIYERSTPNIKKLILALYLSLTIPSILYLFSYTNSMKSDARIELAQYLKNNWNKRTIKIGAYSHPHNYITIKPTLDSLSNHNVIFIESSSFANRDNSDIDFLILSSFEYQDYSDMKQRGHWLKHSGKFTKVGAFTPNLKFAGFDFNYNRNPHDLSYPLVSLELWKRK